MSSYAQRTFGFTPEREDIWSFARTLSTPQAQNRKPAENTAIHHIVTAVAWYASLSMQHVYGGCILNIAAAASDDCTGTLFNTRSSPLQPWVISVGSRKNASVSKYQLWDQSLWDTEVEAAKLNTRAWVTQERIPSPRTLVFARAGICPHSLFGKLAGTMDISASS